MNVLLVFSLNDVPSAHRPLRTPEIFQLGLSYVSSTLVAAGHATRLVVLSRVFRQEGEALIAEALRDFKPGVVGFYAVSSEYKFMAGIAQFVRAQAPSCKLILGGPHASLDPAGSVKVFDAACVGEGEQAALEYITQVDRGQEPTGIANLWIRHSDGRIEKNTNRPYVKGLDNFPLPDRQMWEPWIGEEAGARPTVLLGRGCPFQCTYCCHHKFRGLAEGPYVRFRSPKKIAEEIAGVLERWPHYREVYLEQETIGVKIPWTEELCRELAAMNAAREKPVTFGCNLAITPKIDYDRLFTALKSANVRFVNIGLESGSERLRTEVLRRKYSNQDVIDAVTSARRHGLQIALFNMIGLPTETPEDFALTIETNRLCQPDWHYTSIFYPYPGTDLHRVCKEMGLLREEGPVDIAMERSQATLDLPTFPRKQVQKCYEWFDYAVYRGHKPTYRLLAKVVRSKIKSRPRLNRWYRLASRSVFGKGIDRLFNPFAQRVNV